MALAETAQLLVNLVLKDNASATAKKSKDAFYDLGTAIGSVVKDGFGKFAASADQAQEAQGRFMAATGKSREEAEKFVSSMDGLAGSAGTVGMKFEDLVALGTTVEQQFGTTGQKTQDLTENIAEFAQVTGQDATGAAGDLEDTLSAYGLSADDAAGFMDELVASTQEFGTKVGPESLGVLRDLAPAITDLGGNANDAVGYLNLMEQAGLDAGGAMRGLNTAAANTPDGTTLDGIFQHLASIEDQSDRTKEAVQIFGTQAGVKLAAAIKPGMTSLDDLTVSAQDAHLAVHKGAEAMQTDGDKIRGVLDKIGAGARELGQQFGPALSGLGALGQFATPMAGKLGNLLKQVAALVLPTATAQGVLIGEAEAEGTQAASVLAKFKGAGGLMGLALKAGVLAGVALIAEEIKPTAIEISTGLGDGIWGNLNSEASQRAGLFAGTVFDSIGDAVHELSRYNLIGHDENGNAHFLYVTPEDAHQIGSTNAQRVIESTAEQLADDARESGVASHLADIFANDQALKAAGIDISHQIGDGIAQGAPQAVATGSSAFEEAWRSDGIPKFTSAAKQAAVVFNQTVLSQRGQAQDAWTQFVDMMKKPLDTAAEIADLKAHLASKKLLEGLQSKDPQVRTWAEETRDAIQNRINDLTKLLGQDGASAGQALAVNLGAQEAKAVAAARRIVDAINAALRRIQSSINITVDAHGEFVGHGGNPGYRANGGYTPAGTLWRVNETHTEYFRPNVGGTVLPLAPGGVNTTPQPINIKIAVSAREISERSRHFATLSGAVVE